MVSKELLFFDVSAFVQIEHKAVPAYKVRLLALNPNPDERKANPSDRFVEKTSPPARRQLAIVVTGEEVNVVYFSSEAGYQNHADMQRRVDELFPGCEDVMHGAIIPTGDKNSTRKKSAHKLIIYQSTDQDKTSPEIRNQKLIEDILTKLHAQSWSVQYVPYIESANMWIPPLEVIESYL